MTEHQGRVALAAAVAALGLTAAGVALSPWQAPATDLGHLAMNVVLAIAFPGVAVVIARHRAGHLLAWIFMLTGTGAALTLFSYGYAHRALTEEGWPLGLAMAWVSGWIWTTGVVPLVTLGLLFFPDGRLPGRRWRPVVAVALGAVVLLAVSQALRPGPLANHAIALNPLGITRAERVMDLLGGVGFVMFLAAFAAAATSVFLRWRTASPDQRRQLRWLLYAIALLLAAVAVDTVAPSIISAVLAVVALAGLPVAVGIAIVREGLYDIDVLISRSLVYGALTVGVVVTYVVVVAAVGGLLGTRAGLTGGLVATAVVAAAFQPAREALQQVVSRWVYGGGADPYAAMGGLTRRLEATLSPEEMLPTVVDTIASTLRLPYVAIELATPGGFQRVAVSGETHGATSTLLLTHQGQTLGRLVLVPPRSGREGAHFTAAERQLLEDIARQVVIVVHAVRLTADLQRSREQLVVAREEERRRLHRDLHDGLGPVLAGLTLQLDALRRQILSDPEAASLVAAHLKVDVQAAIAEVRRLVYQLRPPALDELGLVSALRQQTLALSGSGRDREGLTVSVAADRDLPPLPAATEVAAYRIATEAVTNAVRHSGGRRCEVRISFNGQLHLEIEDDGCGLPPERLAGVGLPSMQERAAELGGVCTIQPAPRGGTVVRARLPASAATQQSAAATP